MINKIPVNKMQYLFSFAFQEISDFISISCVFFMYPMLKKI